jgi:hypothetical protein
MKKFLMIRYMMNIFIFFRFPQLKKYFATPLTIMKIRTRTYDAHSMKMDAFGGVETTLKKLRTNCIFNEYKVPRTRILHWLYLPRRNLKRGSEEECWCPESHPPTQASEERHALPCPSGNRDLTTIPEVTKSPPQAQRGRLPLPRTAEAAPTCDRAYL